MGILSPPEKEPDYWAVKGWENTIKKLDYDADIVFLGNSITYYGAFNKAFPDKKVVNLGYPGDKINGMMRRIETIKAVSPEKVFVMAGINGLKDMELKTFYEKYKLLVDSIKKAVPDADIYLQSILPVNSSRNTDYGSNDKIADANKLIKKLAVKQHCMFVDLFSLYVKNNEMPMSLTKDGIHLKDSAYKRWYDKLKSFVQ